jgi:hypothetical protein
MPSGVYVQSERDQGLTWGCLKVESSGSVVFHDDIRGF